MSNDSSHPCNNVGKKDWKKIARANGLAIPDAALEPIARTLDNLEAGFRPLPRALLPEIEPAVAFHAATPALAEDAE
ncbi:MAG TPA: hypothetical protein VN924_02935 [Bryobacteraceae bacterium]|nr:hypothetical protein [Bryobacteraceae bacterium]